MTRYEIVRNEIFKDLPTFSRERYFAIATDSKGRQVCIPCRDKKEALRKRELLQELLDIQEDTFGIVVPFLIDSGQLAESEPDEYA